MTTHENPFHEIRTDPNFTSDGKCAACKVKGHSSCGFFPDCPCCERAIDRAALKQPAPQHTPTPWYWHDFGSGYLLTSESKGRPIVLATVEKRARLCTRDINGILVPITPEHPNAAFIVKAVNAYESDQKKIKALVEAGNKAFEALRYRAHETNRKWSQRDQDAFEALQKVLTPDVSIHVCTSEDFGPEGM